MFGTVCPNAWATDKHYTFETAEDCHKSGTMKEYIINGKNKNHGERFSKSEIWRNS